MAEGTRLRARGAAAASEPRARSGTRQDNVRLRVLHASAKLFLERGYTASTLRDIAKEAEVSYGSLAFALGSKENILALLVEHVIDGQFEKARAMTEGTGADALKIWAAECTLQLHLAESSEHMRELYSLSYSLQAPSEVIHKKLSEILAATFRDYCPLGEACDFYERELATSGIMRSFITKRCDVYFTMERKVRAMLENAMRMWGVPAEEIDEVTEFVRRFDWKAAAEDITNAMLEYFKSRI